MTQPTDLAFMDMAYGLAEKGVGWTSPNPCVGAVVVRRGVVVGAGWHQGPGTPHAEALALRQAGRRAEGATLYVTLEPCVHWGHTPPCVEALLEARLGRVVISSYDPNDLPVCRLLNVYKCGGRMKVVAFLTNFAVVGWIIDHLKLTFVAAEPPPPQPAFQELLMAADRPADYFT